ncbi:MAG TPA: DUF3393 domain-containing protein [Sulfurimonas autotrophica]|nr:DUF3393 domain-containing protein [Sulfurimonas autotrophica]
MFLKMLILFGFTLSLYALSAQEEIAKMQAEFEAAKSAQNLEFKNYKESLNKTFKAYKKELAKYWKNPELSTKNEWVSYSQDKKSRSKVDFKNDTLVVEVIAKDEKEAQKKLENRVAYAISKNTKEVVDSDELQRKIAILSKKSKRVINSQMDAKPILSTLIFEKKPTEKEVQKYSKAVVRKEKIVKSDSKIASENLYKVVIQLPKNSKLKRSEVYKKEVFKNAQRFQLPVELVFAIIQTESNFNPFAKSHIPAFGLMQIVPHSAGRDTYRLLYKKDGIPSATYLYNGKNNIEMGSSYLYILYYRYLKKIKNPQSRLYCAIAAYNTGAGNIAWAFTRRTNMRRAAQKINAMNPDEVYEKLLSDLRYDEPKHYLRRVKKRMQIYKEAYQL